MTAIKIVVKASVFVRLVLSAALKNYGVKKVVAEAIRL